MTQLPYLDWKYLLYLELTATGFASVLSEFRTRLIENEWEHKALDKLLALFREWGSFLPALL